MKKEVFKILMISFFLVSQISMILFLIFMCLGLFAVGTVYYILPLLFFLFGWIFCWVCFSEYTNRTFSIEPILHNPRAIIKNNIVDDVVIVEFTQEKTWKIGKYEFDTYDYLFPRRYIVAWFIRNLNYEQFNARKLRYGRLSSPQNVNFDKVILRFIKGKKTKDFVIVKNNKTKYSFITDMINLTKFYKRCTSTHVSYSYYEHMDEIKYFKTKR